MTLEELRSKIELNFGIPLHFFGDEKKLVGEVLMFSTEILNRELENFRKLAVEIAADSAPSKKDANWFSSVIEDAYRQVATPFMVGYSSASTFSSDEGTILARTDGTLFNLDTQQELPPDYFKEKEND